jgi:DNA-directed RNA polymerase III subunit RPC1
MFVRSLAYGDREKLATDLKVGDIVERHMQEDDVVLFNRQPSLHKLSIMAHKAKVMPWRTFRFNECVCAPYNADFDGDEMNMHLPQTEEARAEALMLMGVHHNLITPKNGEPLVAATQDFLTAAYLLTQKNIFLDKEHFCMIAAYAGDGDEHIDVPMPTIVKPVQLWTGKQLAGLMIRPNKDGPLVNMECKEKNYCADLGKEYFCPKDGYVCFQNSELISGNLAKKTLGDGSKKGLVYTLVRDHGEAHAARVLNRLAKLCARWLGGHKGFSIGIDDVTPSAQLKVRKANLVHTANALATELISSLSNGTLERERGCTPEESLEQKVNHTLGEIRNKAGDFAMVNLAFHNAPRAMAECGSKGSALNVSQMIACVGQQNVSGARIQYGFPSNRTLPHFPKKSLTAPARGTSTHFW